MNPKHVPTHLAFEGASLLSGSGLLGVCTLQLAGAVDLAEVTGGLSMVRGACCSVQVVWKELEGPGAGSMVGMGFPNLVCSLKTWNGPMSPCQGHLQTRSTFPERQEEHHRGCGRAGNPWQPSVWGPHPNPGSQVHAFHSLKHHCLERPHQSRTRRP